MESSDLAAQISPSTISPAPGTSPNSYIPTVKICDNYENYLAPYLKPVYRAIPRTFPLVGISKKYQKIDKSCATLRPWDIFFLNLGQPHDSSLRSRRPYDAAAVWPWQHGVHDSGALSASVALRLLVASWRKARNHGQIFCDQIWGKTTI